MLRHRFRLRAVAPPLLALLLAGCGISFGSGNPSELFTEIRVVGTPTVGQEMGVEVTHEQRYPVPVTISCFLVRPGHSRRLLGRETLPANPPPSAGSSSGDAPEEAEPVEGRSTFRFRPDRPGRYVALCNTPLAPENAISKEFRVRE